MNLSAWMIQKMCQEEEKMSIGKGRVTIPTDVDVIPETLDPADVCDDPFLYSGRGDAGDYSDEGPVPGYADP